MARGSSSGRVNHRAQLGVSLVYALPIPSAGEVRPRPGVTAARPGAAALEVFRVGCES